METNSKAGFTSRHEKQQPMPDARRKVKIRVGVIFGGRSAEHEVSLVSAASIIGAFDKDKYDVVPIGITPDGKWLSSPDAVALLKSKNYSGASHDAIILPDPREPIKGTLIGGDMKPFDVLFPLVHGKYGEDGCIQGLFELAELPYVGAGVLGSAIGMDKVITKQLCEHDDIPVAPYIWFIMNDFQRTSSKILTAIERKLHYPCFVKPANSGSSIGISKAHDGKELIQAIALAAEFDTKILVEKSIEEAREIEVSVLGGDDPVASVPGEIISSNEFYDYDAKYVDGKSEAVVPANMVGRSMKKLQEYAIRSFRATDCFGMARVDFLVKKKTNVIYFNEINTIPGFTSISMFPKLWEASGIPFQRLLDRLVGLAIERHARKQRMKTSIEPKTDWYKR